MEPFSRSGGEVPRGSRRAPEEVARSASRVAAMVRTVLGAQTRVLWCGPGVKGNVVSISGIELAVDADGPVPESEMALLQDRIDEMPTPRRVELVDVHAVGDAVRNRILEEGVPF